MQTLRMTLDQTAWPTRTLAERTGQQLEELFSEKQKQSSERTGSGMFQTKTKESFQLLTD